jgi:hypothetical protein
VRTLRYRDAGPFPNNVRQVLAVSAFFGPRSRSDTTDERDVDSLVTQ